MDATSCGEYEQVLGAHVATKWPHYVRYSTARRVAHAKWGQYSASNLLLLLLLIYNLLRCPALICKPAKTVLDI